MRYLLISLLFLVWESDSKVEWLTPMEHDFGIITQFEPVEVNFEFRNISGEAFLIDNVRTTCGCAAPDWTYDAVPADSTSTIRIEYDAAKKGYFRKKITVFFSGQRKSEKLWIEGEVE